MGSKIINFKDLKVEHPNRYKVTDSNGTEDIKKIDFDPGLIYQPGTPESAENFNNIQKNCIYEVTGVRILEGQEEIYDISIDGFNNFEFENLKILMTPNTTNTIKGAFVRLNSAKYIIKNRTDSIGVGQIFSGEKVFLSLDFSLKVANVIGVLAGGSIGTLKELDDLKVNKAGDVMSGRIRFDANLTTGISYDKTGFEFHTNILNGVYPSIGFVHSNSWKFRVEDSGNAFFAGQATATKFLGPLQGNSDTATKLKNARGITVGGAKKTFDGGEDISYSLTDIGAVSKTGDAMSGSLTFNINDCLKLKNDMWLITRDAYTQFYITGSNYTNGPVAEFRMDKTSIFGGAVTVRGSIDGEIFTNPKITTGNKQVVNASADAVYLSNPTIARVILEGSTNKSYQTSHGTLYHTGNKPTPSEIGAIDKTGDTVDGFLNINSGLSVLKNGIVWPDKTNGSNNAYNVRFHTRFQTNNNGLFLITEDSQNYRHFGIQVGHIQKEYASATGTLSLNPLGGLVVVGASSSSAELKVYGSHIVEGAIACSGNVAGYSDIKLKKDLEVIPDALEKINTLNGYTFTRIDTGERQSGVVAQEVQKVLPEVITTNKGEDGEETLGVAYGNMAGLFIEAIKELKKENDTLKEILKEKGVI